MDNYSNNEFFESVFPFSDNKEMHIQAESLKVGKTVRDNRTELYEQISS